MYLFIDHKQAFVRILLNPSFIRATGQSLMARITTGSYSPGTLYRNAARNRESWEGEKTQ